MPKAQIEVYADDREEPIATFDAPWYVDYCREDCDDTECQLLEQCVDSLDGDDAWLVPWELSTALLRLGRPVETVHVAGDLL